MKVEKLTDTAASLDNILRYRDEGAGYLTVLSPLLIRNMAGILEVVVLQDKGQTEGISLICLTLVTFGSVTTWGGMITASTLLRKLGTYSRKNRLYQVFRELGCAIRREFLLKYVNSVELRTLIHAATNKSEAFNGFSQWIAFGGDGTISTNDRDEQRKIIKYNHLVANCVIFHNVFSLSRVLHDLQQNGHPLDPTLIAGLSPYLTLHINRFGRYDLDLGKYPPELIYNLWI